MTPAQYWLIAAIVLFILEVITPGFVLANLAVAAIAASAAAWFGASLNVQLIVFVVTCLVSFVTLRPLLKRTIMKGKHAVPTGTDALIGRVVRVTEDIPPPPEVGRVQIDGDSWQAVSQHATPIAMGATVRILRVESASVYVELVN